LGEVPIAVAGLENCASSLVQGIEFYRDAAAEEHVPGLMHVVLGGYRVGDIEVVAAFDVAQGKVGRDLAEAILAEPNNTHLFARVPGAGVTVLRGPTMGGVGKYLREMIEESDAAPVEVADVLRRCEVDVMVPYLPVGSEQATRWYAEQALIAGCAFVNCIPVFIASDTVWPERFERRGLLVVGDDIKSQLGATILHRMIVNLFRDAALAKRCRLETEDLAALLVEARRHVPFVQANLLGMEQDEQALVDHWRRRLLAGGVWANEPVPLYPYPSSPGYRALWGEPDDVAWERAHDHCLAAFPAFSDIQEQWPVPLPQLEAQCCGPR
jgi:hypothetical protein